MPDDAFHARPSDPNPNMPDGDAPTLAGNPSDDDGLYLDDAFEPNPDGARSPLMPGGADTMLPDEVVKALAARRGGILLSGQSVFATNADPSLIVATDPRRVFFCARVIPAAVTGGMLGGLRRNAIPLDSTGIWNGVNQSLPFPSLADPTLTPYLTGYSWSALPTTDAIAWGAHVIRYNTLQMGTTFTDKAWWYGASATAPTPTLGGRIFADPIPGTPGARSYLENGSTFDGGATTCIVRVQGSGYALPTSGKPFSLALSDDKGMMGSAALVELNGDSYVLPDYTGAVWAAPMPSGIAATPQTIPTMSLQWWAVCK